MQTKKGVPVLNYLYDIVTMVHSFSIDELYKAMFWFKRLILGTYIFSPQNWPKYILIGLFWIKQATVVLKLCLNSNYFVFPRRFIKLNRF